MQIIIRGSTNLSIGNYSGHLSSTRPRRPDFYNSAKTHFIASQRGLRNNSVYVKVIVGCLLNENGGSGLTSGGPEHYGRLAVSGLFGLLFLAHFHGQADSLESVDDPAGDTQLIESHFFKRVWLLHLETIKFSCGFP